MTPAPGELQPPTSVRAIQEGDPAELHKAFLDTPWARDVRAFEEKLAAHRRGERVVLVGTLNGEVAAHGTLVWWPAYPPFRAAHIAEIQDLNVAPPFRRRGLATAIIVEAERRASERTDRIGIGFGLHAGYGAAQQLYVRLGYVPDGRGVSVLGQFPAEGQVVMLDDDLTLYLTKRLR
jgi:GNAT superfamily N-acetyltransferase